MEIGLITDDDVSKEFRINFMHFQDPISKDTSLLMNGRCWWVVALSKLYKKPNRYEKLFTFYYYYYFCEIPHSKDMDKPGISSTLSATAIVSVCDIQGFYSSNVFANFCTAVWWAAWRRLRNVRMLRSVSAKYSAFLKWIWITYNAINASNLKCTEIVGHAK